MSDGPSSDDSPPDQSGSPDTPWWRSSFAWTAIGGVAAVLGVVVAIIPLLSAGTGQSEVGGGSNPSVPASQVAVSPTTTLLIAPTEATPTPEATPARISTRTIKVENNHFVDLETGTQVAGDTFNSPVGADLSFGNFGRMQAIKPARLHQLVEYTLASCMKSIEADPNGAYAVFGTDVKKGDSLCVATDDQHIAMLRVARAPIGDYFEGGIQFTEELYQIP